LGADQDVATTGALFTNVDDMDVGVTIRDDDATRSLDRKTGYREHNSELPIPVVAYVTVTLSLGTMTATMAKNDNNGDTPFGLIKRSRWRCIEWRCGHSRRWTSIWVTTVGL